MWGVWNNTDGFTVGEAKEILAGMRIFELAKQAKTVRHYVWSNLDYASKVSDSDLRSGCVLNILMSRRVDMIPPTRSSTTTEREGSQNG